VGKRSAMGPIEESTRLNVAALPTTHAMSDALAEIAFRLATSLDKGAGLAEAAVSRELRAVLAELASVTSEDDDNLTASLSAPVRDQP
jgi:hypothetical protein